MSAAQGVAPHGGSDGLSVSKVLAGGLAAATSAVFGSYFGAFGTVGGAAVGSVATALVSHFYQRSIEQTGSKVRATITGGLNAGELPRGANRLDEAKTVRIAAMPRAQLKGSLLWATVMVFLLGLSVVTGLEMVKGSSVLGNHQGTSVERLFGPAPTVASPPPSLPDDRGRSEQTSPRPAAGDISHDDQSGAGQRARPIPFSLRPSSTEVVPDLSAISKAPLQPDHRGPSVVPTPLAQPDKGSDLFPSLRGNDDNNRDDRGDRENRQRHRELPDELGRGLSFEGDN
jgi:hypothetical protein